MKDRTIVDVGTYDELNARHTITECILADDGGVEEDDTILEEAGEAKETNGGHREKLRKERIAKRLRRMDSVGKLLKVLLDNKLTLV